MTNITTRERTYLIQRQSEVQDQSLFRYDVKNQTPCGYYYSKFYRKRKKRK